MAGHEGSTVIVGLNGLRLLASSAWRRAQGRRGAVSRRGRDSGATAGCTVTVCRGCCCGTAAGFDHAGQLARLRIHPICWTCTRSPRPVASGRTSPETPTSSSGIG
ncbi:hypothetical protein GCM10027186_40170 [Micromonospora schwarzwaldensis]